MARAAVLGRLIWRVARVEAVRDETATARTLVLDVAGWPGHLPGQHVDVRLTAARLAMLAWPPSAAPACFVCGPTGFVEAVANLLVDQGHDPRRIRTERFGPSGT